MSDRRVLVVLACLLVRNAYGQSDTPKSVVLVNQAFIGGSQSADNAQWKYGSVNVPLTSQPGASTVLQTVDSVYMSAVLAGKDSRNLGALRSNFYLAGTGSGGSSGFNVPAGSFISGIQVDVYGYATGASVQDYTVQLRSNALAGSTRFYEFGGAINDRTAYPFYPTTAGGKITYGGPDKVWFSSAGVANPSVDEINSDTFKVQISSLNAATPTPSDPYPSATLYIDRVTITVFYSLRVVKTVTIVAQSSTTNGWLDQANSPIATGPNGQADMALQSVDTVYDTNTLAIGQTSSRFYWTITTSGFQTVTSTTAAPATILGVRIDINAKASNNRYALNNVQIGINRNPVGDNKCSSNCAIGTADGQYVYGGARDLFGQTVTPAFVNDVSFGGTITGQVASTSDAASTFSLNQITMTIYYKY